MSQATNASTQATCHITKKGCSMCSVPHAIHADIRQYGSRMRAVIAAKPYTTLHCQDVRLHQKLNMRCWFQATEHPSLAS